MRGTLYRQKAIIRLTEQSEEAMQYAAKQGLLPQKLEARQSPKKQRVKIDKQELFALSLIENMGNATAAAREVFKTKSDAYASKKGSEMVRNRKVQKIISEYLEARRKSHRRFMEQSEFYLTAIARTLIEIMENKDLPTKDRFQAIDALARFAGVELSEAGAVARIRAEPLKEYELEQKAAHDRRHDRKVLFLLSPPPMPPGGIPTPALEKQWREMGWTPQAKEETHS